MSNRDPQSGSIRLVGNLLGEYQSGQLYDWIAVVPQHVHLFNTTIRRKLSLAKPDASQQQLEQICAQDRLLDVIQQQPDGFDIWIGETGIKVSGGQERRLVIAGVLLRDFDCLVLDQPGEELDCYSERELISDPVSSLGDRSLLLITHSHSGLELMDERLVLDQCLYRTGSLPRSAPSAGPAITDL